MLAAELLQVVDVNEGCKNVTVANIGAAPAKIELLVTPSGAFSLNKSPLVLDMVSWTVAMGARLATTRTYFQAKCHACVLPMC